MSPRTSIPLLFLLLLLTGGELFAQQTFTATPRVQSFSTLDYSGEGQNWDIAQDENGLLYVANAAGVLRFDGARWAALPLPGQPTVRALATTNNRLFAGGYGEFGYFDNPGAEDPIWTSLSANLNGPARQEEIWNIEVLTDGTVVFQSFGSFFLYDGSSVEQLAPPGVMLFAEADGEALIVPVTGRGVFRWSRAGGYRLLPGTEALGEREVVGITIQDDGLLLAVEDGIFAWGNGVLRPWKFALNQALVGREINHILRLKDGTLAIGTITSGVYFFDERTDSWSTQTEATGLANNTVLSLFESKAGNVWLGLDRGLDLVVRSAAVSFRTGNDRPPGALYAALRYAGATYLGTNQGLFRQDSSAAGLTYEMVPGTSGQVWELRATPAGLLCGHNEGTFLVEGVKATLVSDRSGGWQTVEVDEASDRLLQATYTGLQLLEISDDGVAHLVIPGFSAPIRYLGWAGRRKLLALHGSRGGFVLQLSEDCRRITAIDTLKNPRLIKASIAVFNDTLLLQSQEGLLRYVDGQLLPIDNFRGVSLLPGQYCLPGRHPGEWFLCSPDRISVYQGREQIAELPLRMRFPFPVILPWENEDYLFLLEEGYASVRPRTEGTREVAMTLRTAYRADVGWRAVLETTTIPKIAYANNDLRFTYALPAFDREVRYRSRLVGYAGDWSAWSALVKREFTNLPEGDYRFEVAANWFGSRAEVQFQVLPPWYRSRLAYLAYALLLIGLFWWLYWLHLRRLVRQARHLEVVRRRELQRERTLARNRELREDIKRKSKELANTTLTLAKKNELLLALKEELDKGRKRSDGQIDLRKAERLIERNLDNEADWAIFESHFNEVHEAFLKRLREQHPGLTTGELKLAAYLRMDLSSKEIAPLLHISLRGVENKRYRLRKKLGLGSGDDLNRYLLVF